MSTRRCRQWDFQVLPWALWLLGLPSALAVVVMLMLADRPAATSVQRLETVLVWQEALPAGTPWSLEGFTGLMGRKPDFASAPWATTTLPNVIELPPQFSAKPDEPMARAWFRFSYRVPADHPPEEPLALYGTRIMGGAQSLWVNGQLVTARLDDWRMQWSYPVFMELPLNLAQPGQTLDVALAVPYRISQGYAVGSLYFGRASELDVSRGMRLLMQRTLPVMGMVLVGLFGMLSLTMWLRRRVEREHLWLSLLAWSVVVCNLQYTHEFSANETASRWFGFIVDASVSWMFMIFFGFWSRLAGTRFPKTEFLLVVFTVGNTLLTAPIWGWEMNAMVLQHYVTVLIYLRVLFLLPWHAWKTRSLDHALMAMSLWCLVCAGVHDVALMATHLEPDQIWVFPYGAFLIFAMAQVLIQRRYLRAMATLETANERMERKLAEHEAELMAQQAALLRAESDQTSAAERARLVHEIHGHVGERLQSTASRLSDGSTDTVGATRQLQACIDDLKLMIDSLDPEARNLEALLGSLRYRFSDRLDAAGIRLEWQVDDLPPVPWLDAPQALEILRAIFALMSDAIKNGGARHLRLAAKHQGGQVHITLESDAQPPADPPSQASVEAVVRQRLESLSATTQGQGPMTLGLQMAPSSAESTSRRHVIAMPV